MFFMETGQAACQISISYALKALIDRGVQLQGSLAESFSALWPELSFFLWLCFGVLVFSRISGALLVLIGPSLRRLVRGTTYHYLQHHSQRFFINNFSGALANRVNEVAIGVNHSLWILLFDFWPMMVSFTVSLCFLWMAHSVLALAAGAWILLYVLVSFALASFGQKFHKRWADTRSTVSGKIVDGVANALAAKVFARMEYERAYLDRYLNLEVREARKALWFTEAVRWFQIIATTLLQVGLILLALDYWLLKKISVGSFAMAINLVLLMINDARGLSRRFIDFFEQVGNVSDGVSKIIQAHEVVDLPNAEPLVVTRGEIQLIDVNFGYGDNIPVLRDLNVRISAGQSVGLVGFSGSGKTTFSNLILRMYNLDSGTILIDGQDIAACTQDSLRAQISVIPQDPILFHRSLMDNIRYGRAEATDEEVVQASVLARAHEFVLALPEGYSTIVGERG